MSRWEDANQSEGVPVASKGVTSPIVLRASTSTINSISKIWMMNNSLPVDETRISTFSLTGKKIACRVQEHLKLILYHFLCLTNHRRFDVKRTKAPFPEWESARGE